MTDKRVCSGVGILHKKWHQSKKTILFGLFTTRVQQDFGVFFLWSGNSCSGWLDQNQSSHVIQTRGAGCAGAAPINFTGLFTSR